MLRRRPARSILPLARRKQKPHERLHAPSDVRIDILVRVGREDRDPVVTLGALEDIAHLLVRIAAVTSLRLPRSASASSNRSAAPDCPAFLKTRSRFFSVSPMYLLATRDRSMRYRSSPCAVANQ